MFTDGLMLCVLCCPAIPVSKIRRQTTRFPMVRRRFIAAPLSEIDSCLCNRSFVRLHSFLVANLYQTYDTRHPEEISYHYSKVMRRMGA